MATKTCRGSVLETGVCGCFTTKSVKLGQQPKAFQKTPTNVLVITSKANTPCCKQVSGVVLEPSDKETMTCSCSSCCHSQVASSDWPSTFMSSPTQLATPLPLNPRQCTASWPINDPLLLLLSLLLLMLLKVAMQAASTTSTSDNHASAPPSVIASRRFPDQ